VIQQRQIPNITPYTTPFPTTSHINYEPYAPDPLTFTIPDHQHHIPPGFVYTQQQLQHTNLPKPSLPNQPTTNSIKLQIKPNRTS
jgi:hypothetical protein